MRFHSVSSALRWYVLTRGEGSIRTTRLETTTSISREPSSTPGASLTAVCEIGQALTALAEIERITLLLRHGEGWGIEAIRVRLGRLTRKRYLRRTVLDDLAVAEIVLDEELRRRGLLGEPEE